MPVLKSLDAYICHRCWRKLTKPSQRIIPLPPSGNSSLHTSSRALQEPQLDTSAPGQAPPRNVVRRGGSPTSKQQDDDGRVRPQGWRALLQNKSLGEAASVLVLRDTEEKRNGRRRHTNVEENSQSHAQLDVTKLLDSLKNQEVDPAQSEVNSSIESLRPDVVQELSDRPVMVSQADYDRVTKQISDGFNQLQLARYITQNLEGSTLNTSPKAKLNQSTSAWQPPNTVKGNTAKKRNGVGRGKRALAVTIVRDVWHMEIEEEVRGQGSIHLHLDREKLAFALLEDKHAAFRHLENTKGVQIHLVETKRLIRILGPKYASLETKDEIDAMLQEPYETELDVRPLKAFPRWKRTTFLDEEMLRSVAESCRCTLQWKDTKSRDTLIVRGREKQATDIFQRMLLANFELEDRNKDFLMSSRTNDDGIITMSPPEERPLHGAYHTRNLGRFTTPFKIAAGQHGVPKQLPAPRNLPQKLIDATLQHLQESAIFGITLPEKPVGKRGEQARWTRRSRSDLSARFGHIQHYLQPGNVTQRTLSSDILGRESAMLAAARTNSIAKLHVAQAPLFIPSVNGLPHALRQSFYDDVPSISERRIRVTLYPSPWTYSKPGLKGMPSLEMYLSIHPRDRHIDVTELTATLGTRSANIMLPNLGTDMIVTRRDSLALSDPGLVPSIQQYLNTMMASYGTTGQISVPLSLRLRVPTFTLIKGALRRDPELLKSLDAQEKDIEVDYFATSVQHEMDLCLPYEAYDLVYTRSRDGDTGRTSEGISLRNPPPFTPAPSMTRQTGANAAAPADSAQLDIPNFLEAAQMLLRQLNIGTGKTQRLDDYIKRADRAKHQLAQGGDNRQGGDEDPEPEIQLVL